MSPPIRILNRGEIFRQTEKYLKLVGSNSPLKLDLASEGMMIDLMQGRS